MAFFDNSAGVSKNTTNYNRSNLAIVVDANGETGALYLANGEQNVELVIAGTFVGTLAVQSAPINTAVTDNTKWGTIASYTEPTAKIIEVVAPTAIRVRSTAWTSGAAYTSLIGNRSAQDTR